MDLEGLVDEYSNMILRIAMHQLKSRSEAEDMVQNVFLKLVRKQPDFRSKEHEKAWIIRVTINLCKDYVKTAWFRRRVPLLQEPAGTPEYETLAHEENFEMLSVIHSLPRKYRTVIYLYYYEQWNIKEISGFLQVRESTVMSWLHRARAQLRVLLKGEFDHE